MVEDTNEELEEFRRRWKEEVSARSKTEKPTVRGGTIKLPTPRVHPGLSDTKPPEDVDDLARGYDFDLVGTQGEAEAQNSLERGKGTEPVSALEHYEKAVERETEGDLGESLSYYRKAFRMNDRVDHEYKRKHFPPPVSSRPNIKAVPPDSLVTAPNTVDQSLRGRSSSISAVSELLATFSNLSIESAQPEIADDLAQTCHIARLPPELLAEILLLVAADDVAATARLAMVCKRLAYLVATEDRIWKHVCHGSKYGFGAMHFEFRAVNHSLLSPFKIDSSSGLVGSYPSPHTPPTSPISLPLTPAYPTYRSMFRHRPRLRFAGVYISTNNYVRPGQSSPNQITWNTPVHIVVYYRYLRFYRDGSCLSLCTTAAPPEVVPHLHARNMPGSSSGGHRPDPEAAALMREARRGYWRVAPPAELVAANATTAGGSGCGDDGENRREDTEQEEEGSVSVETQGAVPDYTYTLHLRLRSAAGAGARHTKLAWRGFWSYNRRTDDWAEFQLRNDRAFVWSRVRSWADA